MSFSNPIVGGTTLIRPAIHSPDYVTGVSGWTINKDGSAEFSDVTIRGSGSGDSVIVGPSDGPQVQIGSTGTAGYIELPTNRAIENKVSTLIAAVGNSGAVNEYATLQMLGPSVDGATDQLNIQLNSQNNDGTSNANFIMRLFGADFFISMDKTSGMRVWKDFRADGATTLNSTLSVTGASTLASTSATSLTVSGATTLQGTTATDLTATQVLTAANRLTDTTSITPVAGVPTSKAIVFPQALTGTSFTCQVTANTSVPGTTVQGVGYTALSSTGVTLWVTRTNATATTLAYTVEGF